ncbi:unnamed protein product, partial [Choristocarpus tenellus]
LYPHQGKYDEAEPLYRKALKLDEIALGPDHPELVSDLNSLALLLNEKVREGF